MATKKAILVVDSTMPWFPETIRQAGYVAGALFIRKGSYFHGLRESFAPDFDFHLKVNPDDTPAQIAKDVRSVTKNIAGVICGSEPSEEIAMRVAKELGVIHNKPSLVVKRRNKATVKEVAKKAGLRVAKHKICKSKKDIAQFVKNRKFPAVIKAPEGGGTRGVFVCRSQTCLEKKHNYIINTPDWWGSTSKYSVLEEYIGGKEYQVNTFSDGKHTRVVDIWETQKVNTRYAQNLYHTEWLISPHDPSVEKIVTFAAKVADITGIKYGPGHLEIKIDKQGLILLESHARLGGGKQPEMVQALSNFDPLAATVDVFAGQSVSIPDQIEYSAHGAIVSCAARTQCDNGTIKNLQQIWNLPSFKWSATEKGAKFSPVRPTDDLSNYPLNVWLAHRDKQQLKQDVKKAHELFNIKCAKHQRTRQKGSRAFY